MKSLALALLAVPLAPSPPQPERTIVDDPAALQRTRLAELPLSGALVKSERDIGVLAAQLN